MKALIRFALAAMMLITTLTAQAGWVSGHYRSSGTYVAPYYRSDSGSTESIGAGPPTHLAPLAQEVNRKVPAPPHGCPIALVPLSHESRTPDIGTKSRCVVFRSFDPENAFRVRGFCQCDALHTQRLVTHSRRKTSQYFEETIGMSGGLESSLPVIGPHHCSPTSQIPAGCRRS